MPRGSRKSRSGGASKLAIESGRALKAFRIGNVLGEGGFGKVRKVEKRIDRFVYALKGCAMPRDEKRIMMHVRECQTMARLESNKIVRYYDAWIEEMNPDIIEGFFDNNVKGMDKPHKYLVLFVQLELCDTDMKSFLKENKHRMDDNDKWDIFKQILEGVEFIHSKGLVHRDMKPGNVLVNLNKQTGAVDCKIADLGLAKFKRSGDLLRPEAPQGPCKTRRDMNMTRGCGTMLYGAPEQFSSSNYGSKADMFAMGIILFEIFAQFRDRKERHRAIEKIRRDRQGVLDQYLNRSPIAAGLIAALLRTDPGRRPSCLDILRDPDVPLGDPSALTPAMRAYMERELMRHRKR